MTNPTSFVCGHDPTDNLTRQTISGDLSPQEKAGAVLWGSSLSLLASSMFGGVLILGEPLYAVTLAAMGSGFLAGWALAFRTRLPGGGAK